MSTSITSHASSKVSEAPPSSTAAPDDPSGPAAPVVPPAVGVAGFLAGAFLASGLSTMLSLPSAPWAWVAFIVGGILGAVMLSAAFEWALIGLSSLSGAMLIANALDLASTLHLLVLLGLFIAGVILQSALRSGPAKKPS